MRKRVALAQTLILDPEIILMDEPFAALDIQTRHLMENELLELWSANRKSVVFITHDLEEAISLSDRVVVMSAGPESHPIGEFAIDLPRPRDVAEIRPHAALHRAARADLARDEGEVLKSYARQRQGAAHLAARAVRRVLAAWYVLTSPTLLPPIYFDDPHKAAFFFGEPLKVAGAHLGLVLVRASSIRTSASRWSRPRSLRHRHRSRAGDGPVARAQSDRLGAARSLPQGAELHAARDPGADLRDVVRARIGRRWRSASRWCSSSSSSTSTRGCAR